MEVEETHSRWLNMEKGFLKNIVWAYCLCEVYLLRFQDEASQNWEMEVDETNSRWLNIEKVISEKHTAWAYCFVEVYLFWFKDEASSLNQNK